MRRALVLLSALLLAGCGSSGGKSSSGSAQSTRGGGSATPQALSAEAQSAATGDIPDNQVFLKYVNRAAGYSISYPEGWTRTGAGRDVTFSDKNNIVHIVIGSGQAAGSVVESQLAQLKRSNPTLTFAPPSTVHLKSGPAVKVIYTTRSRPNPVTGKSVLLVVDRYALSSAGRLATVDLGTPRGVDNVDAYRMMINSFRWG